MKRLEEIKNCLVHDFFCRTGTEIVTKNSRYVLLAIYTRNLKNYPSTTQGRLQVFEAPGQTQNGAPNSITYLLPSPEQLLPLASSSAGSLLDWLLGCAIVLCFTS
jgi:hypothetical protein